MYVAKVFFYINVEWSVREKVLIPLLAGTGNRKPGRKPSNRSEIDIHYENIQSKMQNIFETIGIAA